MPKIPKLGLRGRLSLEVPRTPTADIRQAGIVGESIANLGGNTAKFFAEVARKRKQSDDNVFVDTQTSAFAVDAEGIKAEASIQFAGDQKGRTEFIQKRLAEAMDERLKNPSSTNAANGFTRNANRISTRHLVQSKSFEGIESAKFNRKLRNEAGRNLAFPFSQSPDPIAGLIELNKLNQGTMDSIGVDFNANEGLTQVRLDSKRMASAQLQGLVRNDGLQEALSLIKSNYAGAFGTAEEATAAVNSVIKEHNSIELGKQKAEKSAEKVADKEFETQEKIIIKDVIERVGRGEDISKMIREEVGLGHIKDKTYRFLKEASNDAEKNKMDDAKADFMVRIRTSGNLVKVEKEILEAGSSGQITTGTMGSLLSSIDTRSKKSSPSLKRKYKQADRLMKSEFPDKSPITNFPLPKEKIEESVDAYLERDALVSAGVDPVEATRTVIKNKNSAFSGTESIRGLPSKLLKDPSANYQEIMKLIRKQVTDEKITVDEALEKIDSLNALRSSFENKDAKSVDELLKDKK